MKVVAVVGPALAAAAAASAVAGAWLVRGGGAASRLPRVAPSSRGRSGRWIRRFRDPSSARWLGGAFGLCLGLLLPFPGILLAPLLCLAGSRIPTFLERRSTRRRRASVDAQVPQLLDLLAAGSSAGLSGQLALRRAVDALGGPLAAELQGALDAVDLGARWRDELAAAAERLGLSDLRRTVNALSRTDTLGASLADSTVELAASVRAARRAAVTERARTAPVKMLFPLVFLVLPAFLLLTVVPVLLTTLRSIR
jgi:tight adherence protein C